MKKFKIILVTSLSIASLYANATISLSSSAATSSSNSSSLPSSLPSSGVLSLRQSSLPSSILSLPFPINLLSASIVSGL